MSVTITRTAWTDDDGSGTTGTVINNAVKTELYDQIDAALAAATSAANMTGSHTLPDGVLSTNVPLLNAANAFSNASDQTIAGGGGLSVSGGGGLQVTRNGSDTAGGGPFWVLRDVAGSNRWLGQLGASGQYRMFYFNGSSWSDLMDLSSAGVLTVSGSGKHVFAGTMQISGYGAGTATFDASGNITSSSDERIKEIRGAFSAGLREILAIHPIVYKHTRASGLDTVNIYAGFSAQQVLPYIPEAIGETADGLYSLNDRPILAAVVNAVQALQDEIDELYAAAGLPAFVRTVQPKLYGDGRIRRPHQEDK